MKLGMWRVLTALVCGLTIGASPAFGQGAAPKPEEKAAEGAEKPAEKPAEATAEGDAAATGEAEGAEAKTPESGTETEATVEAPAAAVIDVDKLREELRSELKAEMDADLARREEDMRAEIRAAVAASTAAEEWEADKWEVKEETQLDVFELDGYFRVRMDLFHNFDLNAGVDVFDQPLFVRPGWNHEGSDTLASQNQRLRLQPIFNVSEDVKIKGTLDVLDNLVWGQTPDVFPLNLSTQTSPMVAFTGTQSEPIAGQNAAMNSLSLKRLWAEVMTPVGLLRFGRMASQWGLGVLANDGNCLDCDAGDTVDRIMFITKIADHYIVPAIDTPATGAILRKDDTYTGQPFDLEQRDDVQQYILAVARRDTPEDIEKMLVEGKPVINYGMYNVLRRQSIDGKIQTRVTQNRELDTDDFVVRNATAWIPDLWARLNIGKLRVELEAVAILGGIANGELASDPVPGGPAFSFCKEDRTTEDSHLDICQWGLVIQADYKLARDQLKLGFEFGAASGDSMPGMGIVATPGGRTQPPEAGAVDGKQFNLASSLGELDHSINNFKFDSDYIVDMILWRAIYGQVTDAIYLKPSLSYEFTGSLGVDLAAIYSRTMFAASTPGNNNNLGLELDGTLRYKSSDGFLALIQYGILFPMAGLTLENSPEIAQTVQGAFGVEF